MPLFSHMKNDGFLITHLIYNTVSLEHQKSIIMRLTHSPSLSSNDISSVLISYLLQVKVNFLWKTCPRKEFHKDY